MIAVLGFFFPLFFNFLNIFIFKFENISYKINKCTLLLLIVRDKTSGEDGCGCHYSYKENNTCTLEMDWAKASCQDGSCHSSHQANVRPYMSGRTWGRKDGLNSNNNNNNEPQATRRIDVLPCPSIHMTPQLGECTPIHAQHIWNHWHYAFSPQQSEQKTHTSPLLQSKWLG